MPLDLNFIQPQRATEIALGFLLRAAFGLTTVIDGFAVTPTTVPTMTVTVGQGSIIVSTTVDTLTSGFASLAVDNTSPLVKIGINLTPTTMPLLTAPVIAGQSQNWMIEARFLELDGTPTVLPYYDRDNPNVPYSGPANAGTPNNTTRTNTVSLQWKSAAAAATGQQSTPTPDSGWTGVAIVTLANGQATITAPSITPYGGAPFVPTKLSASRIQLLGPLNLYVSPFGSDTSNSGLAPSSPFATWQAAWNLLSNRYDLNGWNVTVNIANGTYTSPLLAEGLLVGQGSGNSVSFVGNPASPTSVALNVTNAHAIGCVYSARVNFSGFSVSALGTIAGLGQPQPCDIVSNSASSVNITGPIVFGTCTNVQLYCINSSTISSSYQAYSISGGAQYHYAVDASSIINILGDGTTVISVTGSPNFSQAFALAQRGSSIQTLFLSYSGAASGIRYRAILNGSINTNNGGANFFPGNQVGQASTGGQYF